MTADIPVAAATLPNFFWGRLVVVLLSSIVFYSGAAALRSGEIRSRGVLFNRDDDPLGYWFTVLVSLIGSVVIIYLTLTR